MKGLLKIRKVQKTARERRDFVDTTLQIVLEGSIGNSAVKMTIVPESKRFIEAMGLNVETMDALVGMPFIVELRKAQMTLIEVEEEEEEVEGEEIEAEEIEEVEVGEEVEKKESS